MNSSFEKATSGISPYSVRGMWDIAKMSLPEPQILWNGIEFVIDRVLGLAGVPGIGKSRFVANLAIHQILGRDFLGLPVLKKPLTWLFVGAENDLRRYNREFSRFLLRRDRNDLGKIGDEALRQIAHENGFTDEEIDLLNSHLCSCTLEKPEDYNISLIDSPENLERLTETLKGYRPDILVFDTWGDILGSAGELDEAAARNVILLIRKCLSDAGVSAVIFIICHARMGLAEEAKARGFDAGNFMKNSKVLYAMSRHFINLRHAGFDEVNPPIEIITSKVSNGTPPPPLAAKLNPETMCYERIQGFDHDAWQSELEARSKGHRGRKPENAGGLPDISQDVELVLNKHREKPLNGCEKFKGIPLGTLKEEVQFLFEARGENLPDKKFDHAFRRLCRSNDRIAMSEPFDRNRKYVGTPEEIAWVSDAKQRKQ